MFGFIEDAARAVGNAVSDVVDAVGDAAETVASTAGDAAEWAGEAIADGADLTAAVLGAGVAFVEEAAGFAAGATVRFGEKVWDGLVDTVESATESPLGFLETAGLALLTLPLGPALTLYKAGDAVVEEGQERDLW